jgi:hypothetical protein
LPSAPARVCVNRIGLPKKRKTAIALNKNSGDSNNKATAAIILSKMYLSALLAFKDFCGEADTVLIKDMVLNII